MSTQHDEFKRGFIEGYKSVMGNNVGIPGIPGMPEYRESERPSKSGYSLASRKETSARAS